ncbi:MAG: NAD(P)H:quinone oxidoreductase [Ilumatobacter sp.]|uniref:NAD(P)H:quinone oxidoreductase n=1 Tax=Ilumatobacter sp. TaxID=1967498 RepID=UPI003C7928B3
MTIGIVYYSTYGTTYALAKEIQRGVSDGGQDAVLRRVEELMPEDRMDDGAKAAAEAQQDEQLASVDELPGFDGLIIGSPTRFGNRASQMSQFLDQTGPLWQQGKLAGKPAGFFTGSSSIHGGQETTLLTMSTYAFHQGMVIVPFGYIHESMQSTRTGGTPYGPSHFSPMDGSKSGLDDDEIAIARGYGKHFAEIAAKLAA